MMRRRHGEARRQRRPYPRRSIANGDDAVAIDAYFSGAIRADLLPGYRRTGFIHPFELPTHGEVVIGRASDAAIRLDDIGLVTTPVWTWLTVKPGL